MKTICIAGKNDIAVDTLLYCLRTYPEYRLVCVTNKNESGINSWQKSLEWFANRLGVEIISLKDAYSIKDLLFLSTEFDRIIVPSKFATKDLFNIHFSLLPAYKGCYPSVLPILNGECVTGVTLHKMQAGIDTGEILSQKRVFIDSNDSSLDLYRKLTSAGTELVTKNIANILSGNYTLKPQPQDRSTYFSINTIDYNKIQLDTNKTAFQIKNQVRAFSFRPYQLCKWNDSFYLDAFITDTPSDLSPGTIIEDNEIFTEISTIDYNVILYKDNLERLFECIKAHNNELAIKLCSSHKMIESQDEHGWSALTIAVYNNNLDIVEYLVRNGADINITNNNGTNLLMYSKDCYLNTEDSRIFKYLISLGLSPYAEDYSGKNLFDYCVGNTKLEQNLLRFL